MRSHHIQKAIKAFPAHMHEKQNYFGFLTGLNEKVRSQFQNNPSIVYIPSKDEIVED